MNAMPSNARTWTGTDAALPNDGFAVLDRTHRQMLAAVEDLQELVVLFDRLGPHDDLRRRASVIVELFSTTVRRHHEDEERHVFPALLVKGETTPGRPAQGRPSLPPVP